MREPKFLINEFVKSTWKEVRGAEFRSAEYRRRFGREAPLWVADLAPKIRSSTLKVAIRHGEPLADHCFVLIRCQ